MAHLLLSFKSFFVVVVGYDDVFLVKDKSLMSPKFNRTSLEKITLTRTFYLQKNLDDVDVLWLITWLSLFLVIFWYNKSLPFTRSLHIHHRTLTRYYMTMYFFGDLFKGKKVRKKNTSTTIIYRDNQVTNCLKTNYFGRFSMNYSRSSLENIKYLYGT